MEDSNKFSSKRTSDNPNLADVASQKIQEAPKSRESSGDKQQGPKSKELVFDSLVVSILTLTALTNSAYAIIAPFLPFKFLEKGVDQSYIGQVFSAYSVAVILFSPLVGSMIPLTGRRNLVIYGLILMGGSFIAFALISELEDARQFITLSVLARFLQGLGSSLIQTTMYSVCANFFPDHKDAMIGYIEAVTGVGLCFGPLLGSALYAIGGYNGIMYSFGSALLFMSFFVKCVFPARVDGFADQPTHESDDYVPADAEKAADGQSMRDDEFQGQGKDQTGLSEGAPLEEGAPTTGRFEPQVSPSRSIGVFTLLSYPQFVFAALGGTLGYFLIAFMEPTLALRAADFGLNQAQVGLFFMVQPVFYIPVSILVQKVPSGVEKRAIIIIACFLSFFSNLFVGPSELFGFPNTLPMLILGQALRGMIDPFILIPSLPEMIESVLPHFPPEQEFQINDLASGMFNMFLGLGQVLGPLVGTYLTDKFGFRMCCDIIALICLSFSILYFIFCDGNEALVSSVWEDIYPEDNEEDVFQADGRSVAQTVKSSMSRVVAPINGMMSPCSMPVGTRRFVVLSGSSKQQSVGGENESTGYPMSQMTRSRYNARQNMDKTSNHYLQSEKSVNSFRMQQKVWQNTFTPGQLNAKLQKIQS